MIVWGVDVASKKIAFFGGDPIRAVSIKAKKSDRHTELSSMMAKVAEMIPVNNFLYVEEPVLAGARNIRSTILCAESVGMVLSIRESVLVPVSTWKKSTVGKGNASKQDVSNWLQRAYPNYFDACAGDQDLIDAAAIFVHGQADQRMGERITPHRGIR